MSHELPGAPRRPSRQARAPVSGEGVALFAISLGFFMIVLDSTVVNVALAPLARDLRTSVSGLQWVVNTYTIVFASALLTAGVIGDRIGSRRVFLAGLAMFGAASLMCGQAHTVAWLVTARALQGLGAAAMMPTSLALIAHAYPDPHSRARALGLWAGVSGVAITCGPVVGGFLVTYRGWPSIFLLNLPIAALSFALTRWRVAETPRNRARALDPAGQLLICAAIAATTWSLILAGSDGVTSGATVVGGILSIGLFSAFVIVERNVRAPIVPRALFERRAFTAANCVGFTINFGLYGLLFVLSLYFESAGMETPTRTGLTFLPLTAAMAIAVVVSGRVTARYGPRLPMMLGLACLCVGSGVMSQTIQAASQSATTNFGLLLFGGGFGLVMPAMTAVVIANAPPGVVGTASGVLSATRQFGGAAGVAFLGALVGHGHLSTRVPLDLEVVAGLSLVALAATSREIRNRDAGAMSAPSPIQARVLR